MEKQSNIYTNIIEYINVYIEDKDIENKNIDEINMYNELLEQIKFIFSQESKDLDYKILADNRSKIYQDRNIFSISLLDIYNKIILLEKEQIGKIIFIISLLLNDLISFKEVCNRRLVYKEGTLIIRSKTKNNFISKEELEKEKSDDNQYKTLFYEYSIITYIINQLTALKSAIVNYNFNSK